MKTTGNAGGDAKFCTAGGGAGGGGRAIVYPRYDNPLALAVVIESLILNGGPSSQLYERAYDILAGNYAAICAALRGRPL